MPHKDKEARSEYNKRYRIKNADRVRELERQWRARNVGHKTAYLREWHHGISAEKYDEMLKEQMGVCAICGDEQGGRSFHVDHDHVGNFIRGILCQNCNLMLGHAKDSVRRLSSAIEYLNKFATIAKQRPDC
jgi:hypothetical protein